MNFDLNIKDQQLAEWLISNPVADRYSKDVPVMGLSYKTERESGFLRWPIVNDNIANAQEQK